MGDFLDPAKVRFRRRSSVRFLLEKPTASPLGSWVVIGIGALNVETMLLA